MPNDFPDFSYSPFDGEKDSGLMASLRSGGHSAMASVAAIGAAMGDQSSERMMVDQQRQAANASGIAARNGIPQSLGDVGGPVDLLKFGAGKAAEGVPTIAAGLAGGMVAGPVGAGAAMYPLFAGGNLASQYEQSGQFNPGAAAALAVPQTMLNAVSPLGRLGTAAGRSIVDVGTRTANTAINAGIGAAEQGGIGAVTNFLTDVSKGTVDAAFNPLSSEALKGDLEAGAAGALMGGVVKGAHGFTGKVSGDSLKKPDGSAGGISSRDLGADQAAAAEKIEPTMYGAQRDVPDTSDRVEPGMRGYTPMITSTPDQVEPTMGAPVSGGDAPGRTEPTMGDGQPGTTSPDRAEPAIGQHTVMLNPATQPTTVEPVTGKFTPMIPNIPGHTEPPSQSQFTPMLPADSAPTLGSGAASGPDNTGRTEPTASGPIPINPARNPPPPLNGPDASGRAEPTWAPDQQPAPGNPNQSEMYLIGGRDQRAPQSAWPSPAQGPISEAQALASLKDMRDNLLLHLDQSAAAEQKFPGTHTDALSALKDKLVEVSQHIKALEDAAGPQAADPNQGTLPLKQVYDPEKTHTLDARYGEGFSQGLTQEPDDVAQQPTSFKTAKGSTYVVHEDGTTTRNKAARDDVGHEGDSGAKQRTARTVYVDDDASRLSAAGVTLSNPEKGARVVIKDGKATLLTWNTAAGKWGAAPSGRDIPIHDTPAVGRYPLELWKPSDDVPGYEAYRGMHAGNKITEIGPMGPARPVDVPPVVDNSNAHPEIPPQPTQQDRLLEAQRAQKAGKLLTHEQTALLRNNPDPVNPDARLVLPETRGDFRLTGNPTPMFGAAGKPVEPFALEHSPGPGDHPGQGELPLHGGSDESAPSAASPDTKTGDLFAGAHGSNLPWQTRLRMAWKDQSDGDMRGFHTSMKDPIAADSAEEAAAAIRAKADGSSKIPFSKLDALHRALVGEGIEEHATRTAREAAGAAVESARGEGGEGGGGGNAHEADREGFGVASKSDHASTDDGTSPVVKDLESKAQFASQTGARTDAQGVPRARTDNLRMSAALRKGDFLGAAQALATSKNAIIRRVGELATDLKGHTVAIDDSKMERATAASTPKGDLSVAGSYDPKTKQITVGEAAAKSEGVFGHEVVHALTHDAIEHPTPAQRPVVDRLQKLYEHVKAKLAGETMPYGMTDLHEFVTEGMTNPSFQHTLHQIEYQNTSAWSKFVSHVAKLLGIKEGTAFTELLNLHEELHAADSSGPRERALVKPETPTKIGAVYGATDILERSKKPAEIQNAVNNLHRIAGEDSLAGEAARKALADPHYMIMPEHLAEAERVNNPDRTFFKRAESGEFDGAENFGDKGLKAAGLSIAKDIGQIAANGIGKVLFHNAPSQALSDGFRDKLSALPHLWKEMQDRAVRQHVLARRAVDVNDSLRAAYKEAGTLDNVHKAMELSQIASVDPRINPVMADAAVRNAVADLNALPKTAPKEVRDAAEKALTAAERQQKMSVSADKVQKYLLTSKSKLDSLPTDASPLDRQLAKDHLNRASAQAALHALWGRMSDTEKKSFDTATSKLRESLETRDAALNDLLLKSRDGFSDFHLDQMRKDGASDEAIDQYIIKTFGTALKVTDGAYVPFKRFGDWVVSGSSKEFNAAEKELRTARTDHAAEVARGTLSKETSQRVSDAEQYLQLLTRDGDHRYVSFHENVADAKKAQAQLDASGKYETVHRFTRDTYPQHAPALSGPTAEKIIEAVGQQLPDALKKNIAAIVRDMYVDAQPDGSFIQRQAERAGVAGYSEDFSRGVLDQLMRDSFQISALEHSQKMGDALKALDAQRRERSDNISNHIYDTFASRIDSTTDFKKMAKFEQRVSEVTHAFYLGASPGFMLMNMMQMPMITMPMLRARFGLSRPTGASMKAIKDVWSATKKAQLNHMDSDRFTDDEKAMLTRGQNLGLLNMTPLHDTMTTAHASNIIDPKTAGEAAAKGWDTTKTMVNMPAQLIETVNRAATALAAYRLAMEGSDKYGKMDHGAAMDYAMKVVRDSHVDYSAMNNPSWLKNGNIPGARLLFQFKKYWLNMLSMVSMNMYDAFGHGKDIGGLRNDLADASLSAEARAGKQAMLDHYLERRGVARSTLYGLYAMHAIHTGALGMPFAGTMGAMTLANVMHHWFADPEDKSDAETNIRNYLANAYGVTGSNVIMDGIWSGLFGMNIGQRIGMGELATPIRLSDQAWDKKGADFGKELLFGAAGPTAGLTSQLMDGMKQYEAGNYIRGTEKILPKVAGDILKAVRREMDDGEKSPTKGKVLTPTSEWDAVKQFLGVTPTDVADAYKAQHAEQVERSGFMNTRNGLIKGLAQAQHAQDSDTVSDLQAKISEFNQRNPQTGLRITVGEVLKARKAITAPPKKLSVAAKNRNARFAEEGAFANEDD